MKGVELHLGWQARILQEPKHAKLPPLSELAGGGSPDAERKQVSELAEGDLAEIAGRVVELQGGKLHYNVCPKCGKKNPKRKLSSFIGKSSSGTSGSNLHVPT